MPSYYPSAKIRLRLTLEDFSSEAASKKEAPSKKQKPTTLLKGVIDKDDTLKAIEDPEAPPGTTRFLLIGKEESAQVRGDPALHPKDPKGLTHEINAIIPSEAEWKQNGIRAADQFTCKIKFVDFPIDPRCVRSCAIEFYLGLVTPEDYAAGITGKKRVDEGGQEVEPLNVVPDTYIDAQGRVRSNLRFQGWVDDHDLDITAEGEPCVKFECRDNTQLLIKQEAPSKLVASAVNDDVPIDEAIATYLKHFPQCRGLVVEYRPTKTPRSDIPRLKKVLASTAFVPELGPQLSKGGGASTDKMTVWDYLTDICGAIGHNIRVEGTSVIIQRASTMLRNEVEPREDDPYLSRTIEGIEYRVRAMIYGSNLQTLNFKRQYTKKEPSNIEMGSYDPHTKSRLVVRSPKDLGDRVKMKLPGDKEEGAKWTVMNAPPGIRDKELLQMIADEAYEQLAKGELIVKMTTKDVWSFGGADQDGLDPDLLDMKPTDVIEVLVNRNADFNSLTNLEKTLTVREMNSKALQRLGYNVEFADAYAKSFTDAGFPRSFRVREISTTWNINEGVGLNITAAGYTVARIDKKTPEALDNNGDALPTATAPGGKHPEPTTIDLDEPVIDLDVGV